MRPQQSIYLSYFNNSCRFLFSPIIFVIKYIQMDGLSTIVILSTLSLWVAWIVYYILYTINCAFNADIQSILLLSARPLLLRIINSCDSFVIHIGVYYFTKQAARQFQQIFSFRRTLRVAKNIFRILPIIKIASPYIYISLTCAMCLSCLCRRTFIRPSESFIAIRP